MRRLGDARIQRRLRAAWVALEDLDDLVNRLPLGSEEYGAIDHHVRCAAGLVRAAWRRFERAGDGRAQP